MGKVVSSFRILPVDPGSELELLKEKIKRALPTEATVHKFEEEPIAFGLVALHAHIVMPEDVSGEMDRIEQVLQQVDGVSQVDVTMVRRV